MSATRRMDGAQSQAISSVELHAAAFSELSHACGLIALDDLLGHLALTWCRVAGARSASVGVCDNFLSVFRRVRADSDGNLTLAESPLSHMSDILEELAARVEMSGSSVQDASTRFVLSTVHVPQPVGGVVLWGAAALPNDVQTVLCRISAELLRRAVSSDRMLQEAKLQALSEFAAGAGHEINNPIAAISGRAQLLLRNETDPERRRHLLTIGAQALRVRDMIGDTMLFARPPHLEPQLLDLTNVVEHVQGRFDEVLRSRRLRVSGESSGTCPIWADEAQLCVVVSELLRNAIHASPDGGQIKLDTRSETACDGRVWARLIIRDEGPGLSDESREHLFDPFYSARQAGRGLGFGLSKCWRIVTNHGGQIRVGPEGVAGFEMIVDWPSRAEFNAVRDRQESST